MKKKKDKENSAEILGKKGEVAVGSKTGWGPEAAVFQVLNQPSSGISETESSSLFLLHHLLGFLFFFIKKERKKFGIVC